MNKYTIVPSELQIQSGPEIDQNISLTLESKSNLMVEYDRTSTISLSQRFDDERQVSTNFRPTFKLNYIYDNIITGTTSYLPFQYNLYYVDAVNSKQSGVWKGYPQYYEFDIFRSDVNDGHIQYVSKSAYTYNWSYYITYPYSNNYTKELFYTSENYGSVKWVVGDGIPFKILNSTKNGSSIIQFVCIANHGLSVGEYVELSFSYGENNLFQVNSLGDGSVGSDLYVFNIFNYGYTGNTFDNGITGTFKRVINPNNLTETKSKYYVRQHKVMSGLEDIVVTKNGFELNPFRDTVKLEYSSITPNNLTRISKRNNSNSYNFTLSKDINLSEYLDNLNRPISQLYLTLIHKGYSGYFNEPQDNSSISLRQGWQFNLNKNSGIYWDRNNILSNSNIETLNYQKQISGFDYIFYYNKSLSVGDVLDGDVCEWNDYEQLERVVSDYYQKTIYNRNIFQTTTNNTDRGYFYKPHNQIQIKVFSDYIDTSDVNGVQNIPNYSYYSQSDNNFRWRDIYTYGFIDNLGRGVDYPFLNGSHYPFVDIIFKLIPDDVNYDNIEYNYIVKPIIDECE